MKAHPRVTRQDFPRPGISLEGFDQLIIDRQIQVQADIARHWQRTARRRRVLPMAFKVHDPEPTQEPQDDDRSLGVIVWAFLALAVAAFVVGLWFLNGSFLG